MKTISKLDEAVINRIAAGEIIHSPVNAVKELIENSLDAQAKHVQITIKNGGLELIQIKDDGCGIEVVDLPLVCERHTTSKIKDFKDMQKLKTFGFRGEALASISHVANVIIVSKSNESFYGFKATYKNSSILSKPKLCPSNYGTIITIQDLFDNTPSRKKAMKSANEEFNRIADCVRKYAIHNTKVGFSLKKDTSIEIADQAAKNSIDRIRQIYSNTVTSRLNSTEYRDSKWHFKLLYTDINMAESLYKVDKKNSIFILFVNNRLVENTKIKKQVKQVYTNIKKDNDIKSPFVYISLDVNPNYLDVNIHPTKNEVRLLDEDLIVEKMVELLTKALEACNIKKKNPPAPLPKEATLKHYFNTVSAHERRLSLSNASDASSASPVITPPSPMFIKKGPLDDYFLNKQDLSITADDADPSLSGAHGSEKFITATSQQRGVHYSPVIISPFSDITNLVGSAKKKKRTGVYLSKVDGHQKNHHQSKSVAALTKRNDAMLENEKENLQEFKSIMALQQEIINAEDKAVSIMLTRMHCIGCIDDILSLATFKNSLYVMNYNIISEEFFYQTVINRMGQFGKIVLSKPISLCACIALKIPSTVLQEVLSTTLSLLTHENLLKAYFQLDMVVSDNNMDVYLVSLPMVLNNYVPNLDALPDLFYNLATEINWEVEIDCLDQIAHELAFCYCCKSQVQWNQILKALNQGAKFKAPRFLGKNEYMVKLEIPPEIIN